MPRLAIDHVRAWLRSSGGDTERRGCLLASCRQIVEQAQRAGHLDPAADPGVPGGLIVTTHRGLEALVEAGVDAATRNRIADAAVDNLPLPA